MKKTNYINKIQEEIKKALLFRAKGFGCETCGVSVPRLNLVGFMSEEFHVCDSCLNAHFESLKVKSPLN